MKQLMVRIGNYLFRYRDILFPALVISLFLMVPPPKHMLGSIFLENVKDLVAILLAAAGLIYRGLVIGYAYIKRGGLNKEVYADKLVTEGLFTLSRNPLYLGNMLIYFGVFLMHGHWLLSLVGIVLYSFIYYCIIFSEEHYLEQKFGDEYRHYCQETPRWIPVFSRFNQAVEGMEFKFKRVFIKDYTTITSTSITLILIEIYEVLAHGYVHEDNRYLIGLFTAILSFVIFVISVSVLKKRKIIVE